MPRKAKPRTPEQQERDTDLRLQRTYGITLAEYNERLAQQGGGCAICGKPPAAKRLHTDHCHKFAKAFKISRTKRKDGSYLAYATLRADPLSRLYIEIIGATRKLAGDAVKQAIKKASVRGVLCMSCNRGLRFYFDDSSLFIKAAEYLDRFQRYGLRG